MLIRPKDWRSSHRLTHSGGLGVELRTLELRLIALDLYQHVHILPPMRAYLDMELYIFDLELQAGMMGRNPRKDLVTSSGFGRGDDAGG
jgi:hypothetical protein